MAFAGMRGTGDWGSEERPTNFREMILFSNPNGRAPLFAFMAKMKKESTDDPEINWWDEQNQIVRVACNYSTGYDSSDNTIEIDSGGLALKAGDILQIEEGAESATYAYEHARVSSVTDDDTIVLVRGISGTTKGNITDNTYLTKIGSAYEEGTTSPDGTSRNPTKHTNYCQIFKTAVEITNTADKTNARTGDAWKNDKLRKAFDHSVAIELALMFGVANESTGSGSKPIRYMGGLRNFISTNNKVYTTSPTEDDLLDTIHPVFDYDGGGAGDERLVLAGNGFLNNLNRLARNSSSSRINFQGVFKEYGMNLQKWILPQGVLGVRTHPLMNTHSLFKNSAFILNPKGLIWRPLRDTKFMDNIQANDKDSRKGQWLTESTLEVQHENTMAYLGNFVI